MDANETIGILELFKLLQPFDPLLQPGSFIHTDFPGDLDFTYVSRRLERLFLRQRAIELANTLLDLRNPEGLVMIGVGLYMLTVRPKEGHDDVRLTAQSARHLLPRLLLRRGRIVRVFDLARAFALCRN